MAPGGGGAARARAPSPPASGRPGFVSPCGTGLGEGWGGVQCLLAETHLANLTWRQQTREGGTGEVLAKLAMSGLTGSEMGAGC